MVSLETLNEKARALQGLAVRQGLTAAAAESCTGGLIGAVITSVPGSSNWYVGGVISYSNDVKVNVLGVAQSILDESGAVSAPCAASMAQGVRRLTGSDIAVSVTGIAGPDGGNAEKPVGTVWFGLQPAVGDPITLCRHFQGDRTSVRLQTVEFAFQLLRRALLGQELNGE